MTPDIARSYSLLNHVVTVHGVEAAPTLPDRLDALLGPTVASDERRTDHHTILTLRREDAIWQLVDPSNGTPCEPLRSEEQVAQYVEWLAYSAAVRHAELPLILHSGAVVRNGVAVLLPNVSGAGKTTLTLALAARGWLPLTDDVCPLVERDGELVASGCRRCCHLSFPSLALLQPYGIALEGPLGGMDHYFYRPRLWGEPAAVRGIVIPQYVADNPTNFAAITQAECLGQLTHMTFAQKAIPAHERRRTAARLAAQVPAFTLTYSALDDALDVFETLDAHHAGLQSVSERRLLVDVHSTAQL
jgi:hypothetical protein